MASDGRRQERDIDPEIEACKRDLDFTLIQASLALTPEQRLEKLRALQRFAEELRRAGRRIHDGFRKTDPGADGL